MCLKYLIFEFSCISGCKCDLFDPGVDLGGGCRGCAPPPEMTCGFLIQLVFCKKKKLCGLLVLKYSKRRVHPLLKKSWIRPCNMGTHEASVVDLVATVASELS